LEPSFLLLSPLLLLSLMLCPVMLQLSLLCSSLLLLLLLLLLLVVVLLLLGPFAQTPPSLVAVNPLRAHYLPSFLLTLTLSN